MALDAASYATRRASVNQPGTAATIEPLRSETGASSPHRRLLGVIGTHESVRRCAQFSLPCHNSAAWSVRAAKIDET